MTDFKPFAKDTPNRESNRSVAVVLDVASDGRRLDPLLVQPCGGPSLLDRALDCVGWIVEADARIVRTGASEVAALVEKGRPRGFELVRSDDPTRQGARLSECSHLLVLDARHPFLRPGTVDEALRLIKMRFDIASMASCVRAPSGWWFEETGAWIEDALGHALPTSPPGLLREAHAFYVVPAWRFRRSAARFAGQQLDPYPFEVSSSEAFHVQSDFELQLAAAWLASRAVTRAA